MSQEIRNKEKSNPVFNTAKFTLYNLRNAGIKEAEIYLDALGFNEADISAYGMPGEMENKMRLPNLIMQEARYKFINRMIEEKGYKNIFDLACGFSPRGYRYSKLGYKYVGADLPATVEVVGPMVEKIIDSNCRIPVEYCALDLTNPAGVEAAAKSFEGEICLAAEGLMMYFDVIENEQFIQGIRAVLAEHGGCFVTPDYGTVQYLRAIICTIYGQEEGMKLIHDSKKALENTSDIHTNAYNKRISLVNDDGDQDAFEFYSARGFKVERVPFYTLETNLFSLEQVDKEIRDQIKDELHKVMAWVVTLDPNFTEQDTMVEDLSGNFSMVFDKGILKLKLAGRMDSMNTPMLMDQYEEISRKHKITEVILEIEKLNYISSAGLRFLIMLKKNPSTDKILVRNVKPQVKEILDTSGFSYLLEFDNMK